MVGIGFLFGAYPTEKRRASRLMLPSYFDQIIHLVVLGVLAMVTPGRLLNNLTELSRLKQTYSIKLKHSQKAPDFLRLYPISLLG